MTGLAQTFTEATRYRPLYPLIVSRDSGPTTLNRTLARLHTGRSMDCFHGCHLIFLIYSNTYTTNICMISFMTSPPGMVVGHWYLYGGLFIEF